MERVDEDVLADAAIDALDSYGAAVSVVNRVVNNAHIFESACTHGAELDTAGAAAGSAIPYFYISA